MPDAAVWEVQLPDGRVFEVEGGEQPPTRGQLQSMEVRGLFGAKNPPQPEAPKQDELGVAMAKAAGRNILKAGKAFMDYGPHAIAEGGKDIGEGNYARGARRVLSGAGVTAAPFAAPALAAALGAAPLATAATVAGTGLVATGAQKAVEAGGEAMGLTPDQAGLAGDVAAIGAGGVAAKLGPAAVQQAKAAWTAARKTAQAAKFVSAVKTAIPPIKGKGEWTEAGLRRVTPYAAVQAQSMEVQSPADLKNLWQASIGHAEENIIAPALNRFGTDRVPINVVPAVKQALGENPAANFADDGVKQLLDVYPQLGPNANPTLTELDRIRKGLIAHVGKKMQAPGSEQYRERETDAFFAAADTALDRLRSGIYGHLERRGVPNVADLRADVGEMIKLRNAAEHYRLAGDQQVGRKTASRVAQAVGGAVGAATGAGAGGGMIGAAGGAVLGRQVGGLVVPTQSRSELITKAFRTMPDLGLRPTLNVPPRATVRGALPAPAIATPPPQGQSGPVNLGAPFVHPGTGRYRAAPGVGPKGLPAGATPMPPAGPSPGADVVRSVRPATISHEIDPFLPVKKGGYNYQLSSDPNAVDVPLLARPDVRHMLERMAKDLNEYRPAPGNLVEQAGRRDPLSNRPNMPGGSSHWNDPAPASPVLQDIKVLSGWKEGNDAIIDAVNHLLAGGRPTNKLHTAALDAALGYIEKRSGYQGPRIPDDIDPEFEAFSKSLDEIIGQGGVD